MRGGLEIQGSLATADLASNVSMFCSREHARKLTQTRSVFDKSCARDLRLRMQINTMNVASRTIPALENSLLGKAEPSHASSTSIVVSFRGGTGVLNISRDNSVSFIVDKAMKPSLLRPGCCGSADQNVQVKDDELIGASLEKGNGLKLWYCTVSRSTLGRQIRHLRKSRRFTCTSAQIAQKTVNVLQSLGSPSKGNCGKRLLVIINPHSGRGKARKNYHSVVEAMLQAAGFEVVLHVTERPGQATDIVRDEALEQFQAVVAVGGDGTAFEVLQGYFHGQHWQQRTRTPFCLVPSGSGNALSANCGMWDAVTAAYAVCKGKEQPIDIFSVLQAQGQRFYAFLSIYYGMMANLDRGTDHLRWMGSVRFTIGALHEIFQRKRYAARVAFLPSASAERLSHADHGSSSPGDAQERSEGKAASNKQEHGRMEDNSAPQGPATQILDGLGDLSWLDLSDANALPQGWRMLPCEETSFFAAVNLPLLDFTSRTGPQADFDTGCLDLMYVEDLKSRKEGLEFLEVIGKGKHLEGSKCLLEKVAALIIDPLSPGTWLVVDGEDIPYRRVYVEVHPKLCTVLVA